MDNLGLTHSNILEALSVRHNVIRRIKTLTRILRKNRLFPWRDVYIGWKYEALGGRKWKKYCKGMQKVCERMQMCGLKI